MGKSQNLDTKSSELKTLEQASFAKRLLAVLMDAVLAAFIMLGFIALVFVPIGDKGFHYSEKMALGVHYQIASKLYVYFDQDDDGNMIVYDIPELNKASSNADYIKLVDYESDDVEFFRARLKYYYLNYKTGVDVETPENGNVEDYRAPNYLEEIEGKLPSEYYTEDWFNANFGEISTVEGIKNAVLDANKDFYYSSYFVKLNKELKGIQLFIIMPPFVLSFTIFFIVLPLCFQNGETLGKKFLHIGFVTKNGYHVQKRQIVFRQLLLLLYVSLCSFVIGIGFTSLATLGVGVFIYFLATFISKSKRSPMDYLAMVYMIDTTKSVFFKNAEQEAQKQKELDENMEKYHQGEYDPRHVIQIGGEIVDEDLKKEIEEENKKSEN